MNNYGCVCVCVCMCGFEILFGFRFSLTVFNQNKIFFYQFCSPCVSVSLSPI